MTDINYITVDNKLVQQLTSEMINYNIFYRLASANNLDKGYIKLLLAIHDMEIFSLAPDGNNLLVYVDVSDNQYVHSYFYYNYLFSTNIIQTEVNIWQNGASIITTNGILLKMIANMQYPYTAKEKLWIFNTLNNKTFSRKVTTAVKNMLNQLTINQYNKLFSDIALLRLSF